MYCSKCKKQSPDNFENCAYCGAKLKKEKSKKLPKINYGADFKFLSKKNAVISLVIVALAVSLFCCVIGLTTGGKPETVLKTMVKSIKHNDEKSYYSIYDEDLKQYKKEYVYFSDEALMEGLTSPMTESNTFYKHTCGENYKLKYNVKEIKYLNNDELSALNDKLFESYGYTHKASKAAVLDFEIIAKGEKGEYSSVYNNFICIKVSGKWYKAPDVSEDYLKEFSSSGTDVEK